jgi:hypothetical protein
MTFARSPEIPPVSRPGLPTIRSEHLSALHRRQQQRAVEEPGHDQSGWQANDRDRRRQRGWTTERNDQEDRQDDPSMRSKIGIAAS